MRFLDGVSDMSTIDVMVIDPNRLCRQGLEHIFAGTAYRLAFEFDQVPAALAGIQQGARPHLVILDFLHPSEGDAEAVRALRNALPGVPITLLTAELTSSRLARLLDAGADAFLLKDLSAAALERYLNLVMVGEKVFPTRLAAEFLNERCQNPAADERRAMPNGLSNREVQIVQYLLDGQPNKVIANSLGITEATVKVHLKAIMKKTRAANRTQVAIWGLSNGLAQRQPGPTPRGRRSNGADGEGGEDEKSEPLPLRPMFEARQPITRRSQAL
jgi:two-component system, NarL family, nitrate/nitrite response regulator NarL